MFVTVFIHWMRGLLAFRVSRTLTPILIILGKMIKEFVRFLTVTGLSFFLFMFSGNVLLGELNNYSTLYKTAITLFAASLGNFDFKEFDDLPRPYEGVIYMVIYLLFMTITLLNLVIAIFSQIYSDAFHLQTALFLREAILIRSSHGYSEIDTWKVSSVIPFNLVVDMIAFPFECIPGINKERLNNEMLKVCYIPVFLLVVFITLALILIVTVIITILLPIGL